MRVKFKLNDENARAVIAGLNEVDQQLSEQVENEFLKRKDIFLTKDDKMELVGKIDKQKIELIEKIENQKVELIEKIERARADIIKWMFIFWASQLMAMVGLLKLFFSWPAYLP